REAAESVEGGRAFFSGRVGGGDGVVGVRGGDKGAVLQGDLSAAVEGVICVSDTAINIVGLWAVWIDYRGEAAEGVVSSDGVINALRIGVQLSLRDAAEAVEERDADNVLRRVHFCGGRCTSCVVIRPAGLTAVGEVLLGGTPEVQIVVGDGSLLTIFVGDGS